jgi:hypothetical protein
VRLFKRLYGLFDVSSILHLILIITGRSRNENTVIYSNNTVPYRTVLKFLNIPSCKVKKSCECHATGDLAFDLPPIVASRNRQWRRLTVQSDKAIGFDVIRDSPVPTNITPELILDVVELQPTHRRCLYYTDESVALIRFGIRSPALTIYLRA